MRFIMLWSPADIADAVATGLAERARQDDLEQVVYGFDHLDELGLHPLVHDALRASGLGVWAEQRYPDDRLRTSKKSHGKRCDIVLTPDGRPLRDPEIRDTLFDEPDAVDDEQAYWLEVKTVAQHETSGPFSRYSAELLSPVMQDVRKLWGDSHIYHAGLLIVLLTESQRVAEHDLRVWHDRCIEKGYPVGQPALRGFPITDRIGNAWCAVGVFGVRGL